MLQTAMLMLANREGQMRHDPDLRAQLRRARRTIVIEERTSRFYLAVLAFALAAVPGRLLLAFLWETLT